MGEDLFVKKLSKILLKILKWLGIVVGSILLLLIIIILLLRTPWAQQKVTNWATSYVSDKTGTEVDIDKLFITFRGNVQLEGLYLEGLKRDTLLYSRSLEAGVGISSIINGNLAISRVDWDGLRANVVRGNDSTFNFQFLIDSLASGGSAPADTAAADTASGGPPEISLGPVSLTDFRVNYLDSISGMDAFLKLGRLELTTDEIGLASMRFVADELHLENTRARVLQFSKPPPSPEDTTSSPMPYLAWSEIRLNNIQLEYQTKPDTLVTRANIGVIQIGETELELEKQIIDVNRLDFNGNEIFVQLPAPKPADTTASSQADTASSEAFQWPEWQVNLQNLSFNNNDISFHQGPVPEEPGSTFNPEHLVLSDLEIQLPEVSLAEEKANLQLAHLSFREGGSNGFLLRELSFNASLSGEETRLQDFVLQTRKSNFQANLEAQYPSIDSMISSPLANLRVDFNIPNSSLAVEDAYYFQDSLRYNSSVAALEGNPISIKGGIEGRYGDIKIDNLRLEALSNTRLKVNGRITGLPDTNQVQVQIPLISVYTTKNDLSNFVDTATSFNPPQYVSLRGSLRGDVQKLTNDLKLQTPKGDVVLDASFTDILSDNLGYAGSLDVNQLQLGDILQNPSLGLLALEMEFDGQGTQPSTMNLETELDFQELEFQKYNYQDLKLDVQVQDGNAKLTASHKDKNLDMNLTANAVLDTQETLASLKLDLQGADLQDLNFTGRPLKLSFNVQTDFRGNADEFRASVAMNDILVIGDDQTSYRSDSVYVGMLNAPDTSSLNVTSNTISGELQSNTSFSTTSGTLTNFIYQAIGRDTSTLDTIYKGLDMHAEFKIVDTRMLHDIMLPNLERMDSITLDMDFIPEEELLRLDLKSPTLVYSGITIEGLALDLDATADSLGVDFGFDRLQATPIDMFATTLSLSAGDQQGTAYFQVMNQEGEEVTYIAADLGRENGNRRISLNPEKLVLNGNSWTAPPENEIILADSGPIFHNFRLSRNNQLLDFHTDEAQNQLKMDFKNFRLEALLAMFNPQDPLLSGYTDGTLKLLELETNPAFAADLRIDSLGALGTKVGTLQLNADNRTANIYQGELKLNGEEINLAVNGNYDVSGQTPQVDLSLDLQKLGLPLVRDFLPDQLKKASGTVSAQVELNGSTDDIAYDGQLNFNNVQVTPTMLGTPFKLGDEQVSLDNEGLYFDRFTIADADGDKLSVKGQMGTENMLNPTFDLQIEASNFEALDVTEENNELFYGQAMVDVELDVTGDLNLPVVDARLRVLEPTHVYYAVPPSQASINDREGLVRFANMKDSLEVLNMDEEAVDQSLTGYDVTARIEADPESQISILIDPRSNDLITVAGEADLNFNLFPNGNMELVGDYEFSDGFYQLSLYELVKKKFNIVEGSRVVWTGDPMQAELEFTAVYKTEAAPVDLMTERLAGADQTTINRYKQQLPFEVMLYVDGTLAEPEISFGLQMPDDAKDALGGSVYSKVQQLNEDQNDLNKQVFSLIVFDRFLPTGVGSGGGGGGTEGLARSSASRLLTNQLNKLSERYIEGVELNFDVDSYTDYRSGNAEQRTDLNISLRKSFLDERVVVEVGSQVGVEGSENRSQVLGDVSVQYLLTEDGRWRLKAFQENQYQGIIEGQVRITGLGLVFAREFDSWSNLFDGSEEEEENNDQNEEDSESEDKPDTQSEKDTSDN